MYPEDIDSPDMARHGAAYATEESYCRLSYRLAIAGAAKRESEPALEFFHYFSRYPLHGLGACIIFCARKK